MVKVTIRRIRTGLTGVSGLALLGNADLGCATAAGEAPGTSSSADTTTVAPGIGTLTLTGGYANGSPNTSFTFAAQGTTDELVRVGETMSILFPAWDLWSPVSTDPNSSPTLQYLEQLQATVTVQFVRAGEVTGTATLAIASWTGDNSYDAVAQTGSFVIPQACDTLSFDVVVVDPGNGNHRVELASLDFAPVPVFGGEGSLKHAFFDNDYGALRQRILEGGALVGGGQVVITYSDWRADELVNKTGLNLEIGTAQSYGRFGPVTVPIYGQLTYEVSAGESIDGNYFSELALPATTTSRVLNAAGRTAYETQLYVQTAAQLDLYFHVKAYLVANYEPYGTSVTTRFYQDGQRVLLADRYDNPNGLSFTNYVLPIATPPATP